MRHLSDEDLLIALSPGARQPQHLALCTACRRRYESLARIVRPLIPAPIPPKTSADVLLARWSHEAARPKPRWIYEAVAVVFVFALLGLPGHRPPAPGRSMATMATLSTSLPFTDAHARIDWRPGASSGRLMFSNLPSVPHHVLTVWLIHGQEHIPVAMVPLNHSTDTMTVWFSVPHPTMAYRAVGVTLEPAPYRMKPTGPRIFFMPMPPNARS